MSGGNTWPADRLSFVIGLNSPLALAAIGSLAEVHKRPAEIFNRQCLCVLVNSRCVHRPRSVVGRADDDRNNYRLSNYMYVGGQATSQSAVRCKRWQRCRHQRRPARPPTTRLLANNNRSNGTPDK